jgi:Periplasmic binding protein
VIRSRRLALLALLSLAAFTPASAQQPGITDSEIKFGNIMPYSGPASALSVVGKAFAGYFDMVNEKGGINGRKLNMLSLDDGFSPPKTVEATRRLVENDNGRVSRRPVRGDQRIAARFVNWRPVRMQLWLAEKAVSHALLVRVPVPVILIRRLFDAPNLIEQN